MTVVPAARNTSTRDQHDCGILTLLLELIPRQPLKVAQGLELIATLDQWVTIEGATSIDVLQILAVEYRAYLEVVEERGQWERGVDSVGTGNSYAEGIKREAYALDLAVLPHLVDVWVGESSRGTQRVVPVDMWKVQVLDNLETLLFGLRSYFNVTLLVVWSMWTMNPPRI